MFNPSKLLKFRESWGAFEQRHPKFTIFLGAIMKSGIGQDSIVEIKITYPDGRVLESNLKVMPEDVEFLKEIGELGGGQ